MNLSRLSLMAALASIAITGTASAAELTLDRECYVDAGGGTQHPIKATATGLVAGGEYNVGFAAKGKSETGYANGIADASGALGLTISSWYGGNTAKPGSHSATVVLRDSSGTEVASTKVKTAALAISVSGTAKLRSWKISGLAAIGGGSTYYAHYFNHGKYKGRLKIGKASGPCGVYKGKRPLTPFSKLGRYDVKITTGKKFSPDDAFISGRVVVTRRYR